MRLHLLSSPQGRQQLDVFARQGLLCAFDFDGTLAPIVERPEDARVPDSLHPLLAALQQHAPVAVITGRALADIRPRLGFVPDFLVGNHGLEGVPGAAGAAAAEYHLKVCAQWRQQLPQQLAAHYPDPGVHIEDKRHSLSVHYRHVREPERAPAALAPLLAALEPAPRLVGGKCVFNLMPPGSAHKGTALERLMEESGARAALFAGDDITDEDAFRVTQRQVLPVRVESAPDTAAPFFLHDIGEMALLLHELRARLASAGARNWMKGGERATG